MEISWKSFLSNQYHGNIMEWDQVFCWISCHVWGVNCRWFALHLNTFMKLSNGEIFHNRLRNNHHILARPRTAMIPSHYIIFV